MSSVIHPWALHCKQQSENLPTDIRVRLSRLLMLLQIPEVVVMFYLQNNANF
jgi:hypothetical protein